MVVCTQSLEITVYTVKNELADPCCHKCHVLVDIYTRLAIDEFKLPNYPSYINVSILSVPGVKVSSETFIGMIQKAVTGNCHS